MACESIARPCDCVSYIDDHFKAPCCSISRLSYQILSGDIKGHNKCQQASATKMGHTVHFLNTTSTLATYKEIEVLPLFELALLERTVRYLQFAGNKIA